MISVTSQQKNTVQVKGLTLGPGLYVVTTPIGNLRDITLRALDVLQAVDGIVCEDKRVTKKLLNAYGIQKPLMVYHEHNGDKQRPEILKQIQDGGSIALVSDAGTPGISDPGYKLFKMLAESNVHFEPIPGVCAAIHGLVGSALPTHNFTFLGFAPAKTTARITFLETVKTRSETLVFYETSKRMLRFLEDVQKVMPARQIAIGRELTKKFEEFLRGSVEGIIERITETPLRGECVVVISGHAGGAEITIQDIDVMLQDEFASGLSVRDATRSVVEKTKLKKKDIYARALFISKALE